MNNSELPIEFNSKTDPSRFILVFTMGKVGSKTIMHTLGQHKVCLHDVHRLARDSEGVIKGYPSESEVTENNHRHSYEVARILEATFGKVKWRVITSFRDPVALIISSFFHHLKYTGELTVEAIADHLRKEIVEYDALKDFYSCWFKDHLKPSFKIDIFEQKFDKDKGYSIYSSQNADILLFKLEKFNECFQQAFFDFIELEVHNIACSNIGEQKEYKEIYKKVLNIISFPEDAVEKIYKETNARHFYTEQEINHFKMKWCGKVFEQYKLINRGKSELLNNNIRNAQNSFDTAVKIYPTVDCYSQIGQIFLENQFYEQACHYLFYALKLNPLHKNSVMNCTRLLLRLSKIEDAELILGTYLIRNKRDNEAKDLSNVLKAIKMGQKPSNCLQTSDQLQT